jgi:hypothetical protein
MNILPLALSNSIVRCGVSIAMQLVLVDDQALQSNRTTSVCLVSAHSNLSTESVSESICKPGASIPVDSSGINSSHESLGLSLILGQDGVCVFRSMLIDMLDRLFDRFHRFDSDDEIQEFRVIVVLIAGLNFVTMVGTLEGSEGFLVAFESDTMIDKSFGKLLEKVSVEMRRVHKKSLGRVARCWV